ncbi:MAG: DUF928 domain-containing protein [Phormidesmis sp.]
MRQNWFSGTLGAVALIVGTTWSGIEAAHAVSFKPPPDNAAPRNTTGGASRGSFFTPPPENLAPRNATGGASRGGVFTPPPENTSPRNAVGGASRSEFFVPPADNSAPRDGTGGASRGDFFTPPPGDGVPRNAAGGASRGDGLFEASDEALDATSGFSRGNAYGITSVGTDLAAPSMLAVMPDSFYGTTVEARPTILVYVPRSSASEAVFSLKDEVRNTVYEMPVQVPETGGVIAIEMPADAPELAIGENYQWYVAIKLDNGLSPSSPFVDGWVKRIEPDTELSAALTAARNQDSTLAKIEALGANGVWYDTAAKLAKLTEAQANDVMTNHWVELLESVGLDDITAAPIVM